MDVQSAFDFEAGDRRRTALREALRPLGLTKWSIELVVLMSDRGRRRELSGYDCFVLPISKRCAAAAMGCAPNTFVLAARKLQELGCLEIVDIGHQRVYVLAREKVNELVPFDCDRGDEQLFEALESVQLFQRPKADKAPAEQPVRSETGQEVVSGWSDGGQFARVRDIDLYQSRVPNRAPVSRDTCAVQSADSATGGTIVAKVAETLAGSDPPTSEFLATSATPGAASATPVARTLREVSDDDVRRMDLPVLRAGYYDAVAQGWLRDDQEDRRKYLATCHHAATSRGIHRPSAVVYATVKAYDFSRVNQVSWDWASRFLRKCGDVAEVA